MKKKILIGLSIAAAIIAAIEVFSYFYVSNKMKTNELKPGDVIIIPQAPEVINDTKSVEAN